MRDYSARRQEVLTRDLHSEWHYRRQGLLWGLLLGTLLIGCPLGMMVQDWLFTAQWYAGR